MDIESIKDAVEQVFSKSGYQISNFNISCPEVLSAKIERYEDGIKVTFQENLPTLKTKKFFIAINAEVQSIFFGKENGSIKLKYFPDFVFSYEAEPDDKRFGSSPINFGLENLEKEISQKYPDKERKKIAELALKFANEWYTISSENGTTFSGCSKDSKKKLIDNCFEFVHNNIIKSEEIKAKSAILSMVLIYFVMPAIINWVVKRFLNKIFV